MTKTFTHDDLIRFLYQETDDTESQQIENALMVNPELSDSYIQMKSVQQGMGKILITPSKRSVDNILHYSQTLNCHLIDN